MNCNDAMAGFLASDTGGDVTAHLNACGSCRSMLSDAASHRDALRDGATWEIPPERLQEQVVSLIAGASSVGFSGSRRRHLRSLAIAAALLLATVAVAGVIRNSPPDWEISMPGTDLAPAATSTVSGWNTAAGTRMVLQIDGLGTAPPGHVYELWLSRGPIHVSAGTFTDEGSIELTTGVARAEFPRLWVTIEPLDRDQSPSGRTVLDTGS